MDDPRFDFSPIPSWRKHGKQAVYGSEYPKMENYNNFGLELPYELQFPIDCKMPTLFDSMSRFKVQGIFEYKTTATAAWAPCPVAESANVMVCPNWFELLFRNIDLFHYYYQLKIHDEPMYLPGHLNQYMYHAMDEKLKKFLCPEACHPGNSVPLNARSWSYEEKSEWLEYAKTIFTGAAINFTWIPLFLFPFFQGSNHVFDLEQVPKAVPFNHVGKMIVRMKTVDSFSNIFRKKAVEAVGVAVKSYRFRLISMTLHLEEARMNPTLETRLFKNSKSLLNYHGVCKIARVETIPNRSFAHQAEFKNVAFPESIFIFAKTKNVVGGTYKYADETAVPAPCFAQHNIKKVRIKWDGEKYSPEEPEYGDVTSQDMDFKYWQDDIQSGPFGMKLNPKACNLKAVKSGHANTDYPHIHLNLLTNKNRNRMVPLLCDPNVLNKTADLVVSLSFVTPGSVEDVQYFIYLAYTDNNVVLDLKTKKFSSSYGLK